MLKHVVLACALVVLSGCSVVMSASRSSSNGDPSMIQPGVDRMAIEEALGAPNVSTEIDGGKTKAVYKIDPDAHSKGARNAAVAGHVVADVLTFGLWEIVGTPLELAAQDKFTSYIVVYGPDHKVQSVEVIK